MSPLPSRSAVSAAGALKPASSPWLIGPWADSIFFIATPLLIIPAWHMLSLVLSLTVLKFAVLSVSATGHHLPGFIRAYTDPVVFKQYRARLLVVPALLIALVTTAVFLKLTLVFLLLIVWGTYHGIMQIHGFLRIYDGKAGIHSRFIARLDLWMCLTWFIQIILWSSGKKMSLIGTFYMAGGPLIPASTAHWFETGWWALTLAVTAVYLVTAARALTNGTFNPRKVVALGVSVLFWAYCMITVNNLIIGLLLWEIFHDLQYNAFVWSYNKSRVDRDLARSRIEQFLFRNNWKRISIYALAIAAYGCIGFLSADTLNIYQNKGVYGSVFSQIGMVFAASALIHFYMDGFIWKVRDAKVREDLGMNTPGSAVVNTGPPGDGRHWVFVAVVFVGSIALGASEYVHGKEKGLPGMPANLVALIPGNAYAHFMRGGELAQQGALDSARAHYQKAIALDTNFKFLHVTVADLDLRLGDTAAAMASLEGALADDPTDAEATTTLANLYLSKGLNDKAARAFSALVRLEPLSAPAHFGLGFALLQQRRGLDAKPHLERSIELDAAQPAALNFLGMIEHALGNQAEARRLYDAALRLDPGYEHARQNRAQLQ